MHAKNKFCITDLKIITKYDLKEKKTSLYIIIKHMKEINL